MRLLRFGDQRGVSSAHRQHKNLVQECLVPVAEVLRERLAPLYYNRAEVGIRRGFARSVLRYCRALSDRQRRFDSPRLHQIPPQAESGDAEGRSDEGPDLP